MDPIAHPLPHHPPLDLMAIERAARAEQGAHFARLVRRAAQALWRKRPALGAQQPTAG